MVFLIIPYMPSPKGGPFFCVWEAKENLTIEDLQTFIDGPNGVNMGLSALHNIIYQLDTALTGGQVPFDNNSPYLGFTDTAQKITRVREAGISGPSCYPFSSIRSLCILPLDQAFG